MSDQNGGSKHIGRRRLLQFVGVGIGVGLGVGSILGIEGCKDKAPEGGATSGAGGGGAAALDCKTAVDDTSKNLRRTLQYRVKADPPEKHCAACAQFVKAQYGECGGCKLFTGPVREEGGCLSFAPISAEAGAAPAKAPG